MQVSQAIGYIGIAIALWFAAAPARAISETITTSADPAGGWRTIAPVGNLEGQPIASVGLDWEAAHIGWNTSLGFDESDAAGWHAPVSRDLTRYGYTATNSIWSDGLQGAGDTPAYFRKSFMLDSDPVLAQLGGTTDGSDLVDDDAQIYINGTLIYDDQNGVANLIALIDVTAYLHAGQNLLAVKAHDSFGADEHFSLTLRVNPIPEPTTGLLLTGGLLGLAAKRRRQA
jgi:hypothetical protein